MIYLDNAATSWPKPKCVIKKMNEAILQKGANPGRGSYSMALAAAAEVYDCRKAVAEFFNAPAPENVIFTCNCTFGLNVALQGLLRSGDHVVVSDLEHNSVMRPLKALEKRGVSWTAARVDLEDDRKTLRSFEDAINHKTRMIACTHASNVCGRILPAEELGELARRKGLYFVLDAAQSAGHVPVDFSAIGADVLCAPGHKGLLGPQGTGIMIVRRGLCMPPLTQGGTGSMSDSFLQPEDPPERYESGTLNLPGIAGLGAAVRYLSGNGARRAGAHTLDLALEAYGRLNSTRGVYLYAPKPAKGYVPLISFNVKKMPCGTVAERLSQEGICVRSGLHCAPAAHMKLGTIAVGTVRISLGIFNTQDHILDFARSLGNLIKSL